VPEASKKDLLEIFKSDEGREMRFMPKDFPFDCSLELYGNKLAMFSFKDGEVYSMIIESESVTTLFRQFFLFTWSMLGEKK
jgi:hypothetical protein